MTSADETQLGAVLGGKYRLDAVLGTGGVGTVFAATHTWTDRPVAVKLLDPAIARDEEAVKRFLFEAKTATKLRHPNVVDVLDMGADDNRTVYLVMERLEGRSLATIIEAEAPLPPGQVVEMLLPVLDALEYTHAQGVIHRDLKPDNIFISRDARGRTVPKLLDFGIAKAVQNETLSRMTREGTVLGTPHYMSPEQVRGGDLTPRTDLWSMGVILYEALTGRVPFDGSTVLSLLAAIQSGAYAPPTSLAPVPPRLAAAIDQTLSVDPAGRPPDIAALRSLLVDDDDDDRATLVDGGATIPDASLGAEPAAGAPPPEVRGSGWTRIAMVIAALASIAALGSILAWRLAGTDPTTETEAGVTPTESAAPPSSPPDEPPLRFAVSGTVPDARLGNEYAPLVRHLSGRLEQPVELITVASYGELSDRVISGDVDIAWLPALEYVRVRRARPAIRLLAAPVENERDSTYQGLIVTAQSSGIENLEELRGRRFCYVSPTSASGYVYPRAVLRGAGLDPDALFSESLFVDDHGNVLPSIAEGRCDAGATYAARLHGAGEAGLAPTSFRILANTESIPYGPYVASAELTEETAGALREALLAIAPGSDAANAVFVTDTAISGFASVEDAAYDVLREATSP